MHINDPLRDWIFIFVLAAVSPLFINVGLIEVASITSEPMARAVDNSGLFMEHDSFMAAMRVLNALFFGVLTAVVLGFPLGFLLARHMWPRCVAFVLGVIGASAVWHLNHKWGIEGFIDQWRYPEMWLSIFAACAVATLISRIWSRRGTQISA